MLKWYYSPEKGQTIKCYCLSGKRQVLKCFSTVSFRERKMLIRKEAVTLTVRNEADAEMVLDCQGRGRCRSGTGCQKRARC
jgi:hypothetical protein